MMEEIRYPVSLKDLAIIVSGYWEKEEIIWINERERYDGNGLFGNMTTVGYGSSAHIVKTERPDENVYRKISQKKSGFKGTPSSNLVKFLIDFGGRWNTIGNSREKTIETLKEFYECMSNPFRFKGKGIGEEIVNVVLELEYTEELIHAVNMFYRVSGHMIAPRLEIGKKRVDFAADKLIDCVGIELEEERMINSVYRAVNAYLDMFIKSIRNMRGWNGLDSC